MQEHLKDYIWMQLGKEHPIQVLTDEKSLTEKLAAGYRQVDPPAGQEQ